jgi:tRNA nucleotidyltransferase (CCA-adding enzyme)
MWVKKMRDNALQVLKKIEDSGYEAYIVGGFVRDYLIGRNSLDVDICTNATPKVLSTIFEGAIISSVDYGAVTLIYKKGRYELTTYRKEIRYDDHRRPVELEYIDNLLEDLKRRDFTVNTICMNSKGEIIDLLNAREDLNSRIIKMVGDPEFKLKEDVLRILRAIRFATLLNFEICDDVKKSIINNAKLLTSLSYTRKKEELTKVFTSSNASYGISLLMELELDKYLELSNLSKLKIVDDILGIWAQLDVLDIYPFSKVERESISMIRETLSNDDITNYDLYHYGLYIMTITASIKGIDKTKINKMYVNLPIKSRNQIAFNVNKICTKLNIKPSYWINDIYQLLEKNILDGTLNNDENEIFDFVLDYLEKKLLVK